MSESNASRHIDDPQRELDEAGEASLSDEELAELEAVELPEEAAEIVHKLQQDLEEAVEGRKRALADFLNYQRRARESERWARIEGEAAVARSLLPVLDNFDLALAQAEGQITVEQLKAGVQLVRDELVKALEAFGVKPVAPEPGEEFDPNRHEAMYRCETEGAAPNTVVEVLQAGYAMGDLVLRPAKVAVSQAPDED